MEGRRERAHEILFVIFLMFNFVRQQVQLNWLRTTSAIVKPIQSGVWRCLSAIRRSLCLVSWLVHTREEEQSKQWTSPCERAPKKVKTVLQLWELQGVIYNDYLDKGKTVTGSIRRRIAEKTWQQFKYTFSRLLTFGRKVQYITYIL